MNLKSNIKPSNTFFLENDVELAAVYWYEFIGPNTLCLAENRLHKGESFNYKKALEKKHKVFKISIMKNEDQVVDINALVKG